MNTRKYPRTLTEAFGPYTSQYISEKETDYSVGFWIAFVLCWIATIFLIGMTL